MTGACLPLACSMCVDRECGLPLGASNHSVADTQGAFGSTSLTALMTILLVLQKRAEHWESFRMHS